MSSDRATDVSTHSHHLRGLRSGGLVESTPVAARRGPRIGQPPPPLTPEQGTRLVRRAKLLAWGGNAWHVVEFAIAVGAGIAAGSIALVGFGVDSLIEASGGLVVVWLFTGRRLGSAAAERRAQQLVAVSYALLVAYILVESTRTLIGGDHPAASWVGIGLAAFTAPTMPLLASAKRRVGRELSSAATVAEAEQNQICAYLSLALLVGLLANALLGWWWADPAAALAIAGVAGKEGWESWKGGNCDCC
jgi:divalent metal cation (Fe/Co/Zn/Cd) transporter